MSDMRLIDANAKLEECQYWLYRNSLALEQGIITREHAKHEENAIKTVCGVLSHAPTIDAVPVVRCKECSYNENEDVCPFVRVNRGENWCEIIKPRPDGFCHLGKKMDGGDT